MFGLFGKKKSLEEYQKARDWDGLARAYYDLGVSAMDQGSLNMAVLWLHRADTIYSASDGVYEKSSSIRRLLMTAPNASEPWRTPLSSTTTFPPE